MTKRQQKCPAYGKSTREAEVNQPEGGDEGERTYLCPCGEQYDAIN